MVRLGLLATLWVLLLTTSTAQAAALWIAETDCPGRPGLSILPRDEQTPVPLQPAGYSKYVAYFALPYQPVNWTLPEGEVVRVVAHLSGLDQLVPAPHPLRAPQDLKTMRLAMVLRQEAYAESNWDPEPSGPTIIGYEEIVLTDADRTSGVHSFEMDVQVTEEVAMIRGEFWPHPAVELRISGATAVDDRPVVVHMGGDAVASHAVFPSLPYDPFFHMETSWSKTGTCDLLPLAALQTDDAGYEDSKEAPLSSLSLTVAALVVAPRLRRSG